MANQTNPEATVEAPVDEEYEALLAHYVEARRVAKERVSQEVEADMKSGVYGPVLADLSRRYPKQK